MLQKKIANFLFSTRLMAVLFLVFAIAMAVATFLENSYSTEFARIYVYNTWWFELIMILLGINFLGNISKYQLWRKEKWLTLLFHLAFIVILIGAGVTRYFSFEGIMPIKEGQTATTFYSAKTFLTAYIDGEHDGQMLRKKKDFQVTLADGANNHHTFSTDFKGQNVTFEITKFIEDAKRTVVEDPNGDRYLKIVEAGGGQRHDHFLKEGTVSNLNNILFAFNKETPGAINIQVDSTGNYTINTPFSGTYMHMATQKKSAVTADSTQKLMLRSLYDLGGLHFVIPNLVIRGHFDVVSAETKKPNGDDGVFVTVSTNGQQKQVQLMGTKGAIAPFVDVNLGGLTIHLRYGSKLFQLPFSVHLNDFIAAKYPGTANNPTPSYSSFKSKVTVIDNGQSTDHDIYMNHVLDHNGYRFFQSSFMPDESGTVLSVNHDWWGTNITYLGYTLLYICMLLILFVPGSRFKDLAKKLQKIKELKKKNRAKIMGALTLLFLLGGFSGYGQASKQDIPTHAAQSQPQQDTVALHDSREDSAIITRWTTAQIDSIIKAHAVPKAQAEAFGSVVMQDYKGRMKPINTYSSELLRKLSRRNSYQGLNSDQVLLSMLQNPKLWFNVPIIKIKHSDDSLHHVLGVPEGQSRVKFTQFFDKQARYKLGSFLQDAYRAKRKSKFQKDIIDADGHVNLLFNALRGELIRIFPLPNSKDNKWISYPEVAKHQNSYSGMDSLFVMNAMPLYLQSLMQGEKDGNYTRANSVLESIKAFQKKFGKQIMPSETHIKTEIAYNKYDILPSLYQKYLLAGIFMFIFVILEIFYPKKWIHYLITLGKIVIIALFILHTVDLGLRWYVSGHAPWGDAYESIVYVAWATVLFGLIFGRKSDLTVASTAFVASIIMFVAHLNWLDPSIAHLQPVLDSYWIMIHTSVIVASYGPFTLGAILGLVTLILMILTNKRNVDKMKINVKELTIITEMALTVGLVLLTIGNFLGGQWANESWGRYWSWDPKEVWALISIMVYAFVIHMRLVPGLRNRFAFNWAAVIAYGAILFTYFGVNFYLSGLHSYASGDEIIHINFIYISLAIWGILGLLAYIKFKHYYKNGKPKTFEE